MRAAVTFAIALLLIVQSDRAEAHPAAKKPTIVVVVEPTPFTGRVVDAVRAHLQGLDVDVAFEPMVHPSHRSSKFDCLDASRASGAPSERVGLFCIEGDGNDDTLIFLTDSSGRSVLVRRVPRNARASGAALEEAGIVVRAEAEAVLDGARVGLVGSPRSEAEGKEASRDRVPVDPPATSPTDSAPPDIPVSTPADRAATVARDRNPEEGTSQEAAKSPEGATPASGESLRPVEARTTIVSVHVDYVASSFASGLGIQSGFALGAQWAFASPFFVGADYVLFPSLIASREATNVVLSRHPAEGVIGVRTRGALAFEALVAVEVDDVQRATAGTTPGLQATSSADSWLLGMGWRAGLSWAPVEALRAEAHVGTDAVFNGGSYVVDDGGGTVVASVLAFRPRFDVGVGVRAW